MMALKLKGVHVPHRKNTANMAPIKMDSPKSVTIPTAMHIGAAAKPIVKVGDSVKIGTLIAEQSGFVSSAVHASISGTVTAISDILLSSGGTAPAITIESDGEMNVDENIIEPKINNREDLIDAIKNSGIVGLGGAGFPTYVKFATDKEIEYLVINGAECEPYITSDSVTMTENFEDIAYAINLLTKYFNIKNVIIGIENNKSVAIKIMKNMAKTLTNASVKVLPSLYPQGAEKVLVYHTTGRKIPLGKLPIDVGCVVANVTTISAIGKYLKTGIPLVEKCVTVDGSAVAEPKNVITPIGTSIKDLVEFSGGLKCEAKKVLYGGPMMGISVPNMELPIIKNTNAILVLNEKEATLPKTTACIKCGSCTNHCPLGINPRAITKAYKNDDFSALEELGVNLCMECGCCSFVCPAKIPLVQNNRLSKQKLKEYKLKEEK